MQTKIEIGVIIDLETVLRDMARHADDIFRFGYPMSPVPIVAPAKPVAVTIAPEFIKPTFIKTPASWQLSADERDEWEKWEKNNARLNKSSKQASLARRIEHQIKSEHARDAFDAAYDTP